MILRQSLSLGVATIALAGTASAQSRDDLLDALTRHIQICSEITETQARLACFDRLQTQIGGVQAPARSPTPLQANPAPAPAPTPTPIPPSTAGTLGSTMGGGTTGSSISSAPLTSQPLTPQPLAPQPLGVPGGGTATLGSSGPTTDSSASRGYDPDAAFDPRNSTYRPGESTGPKPQPQLRRTGQRPIPYSSTPQPLVTLGANNLTYGPTRYWQVTVTLSSNTQRPVETQAVCTFMNGGRSLEDAYLGPVTIQPGEQITTELIGPPTTTYVDSTNCRVMRP
ncbi:MAG: hypothetical protein IKE60_13740 [Reyranella sp.]|jgi:hypothetical protein|uniref:hypothetical protein n=1 Tax=Reyranella sp. TaxID=1929291 RepID=UPI00095B7F11|nr:hypothetical protein [Reyranella sp.]MBN9538892.1 hypothetical protein [Alphaproteobacteria bacterium]MBR2815709.1 hypothetical protein [Reyranella sp.]OJU31443.1 MAG: hypothetical protein BGN99_29550 [Alphaproteobacteria bacterium 65-37]